MITTIFYSIIYKVDHHIKEIDLIQTGRSSLGSDMKTHFGIGFEYLEKFEYHVHFLSDIQIGTLELGRGITTNHE